MIRLLPAQRANHPPPGQPRVVGICLPGEGARAHGGGRVPSATMEPAQRLCITEKVVGKHSTSIFMKLDLAPPADDNRRVLAPAFLNS